MRDLRDLRAFLGKKAQLGPWVLKVTLVPPDPEDRPVRPGPRATQDPKVSQAPKVILVRSGLRAYQVPKVISVPSVLLVFQDSQAPKVTSVPSVLKVSPVP